MKLSWCSWRDDNMVITLNGVFWHDLFFGMSASFSRNLGLTTCCQPQLKIYYFYFYHGFGLRNVCGAGCRKMGQIDSHAYIEIFTMQNICRIVWTFLLCFDLTFNQKLTNLLCGKNRLPLLVNMIRTILLMHGKRFETIFIYGLSTVLYKLPIDDT